MKNKGFTLLELMIVIAIMGILVAVVSPNFNITKHSFDLQTIGRDCVADLRYAQQLSIDTKEEYGVYFSSYGYQIKKNGVEVIKQKSLDKGVAFEKIDGNFTNNIVFKKNGSPYESGKIFLKQAQTNTYIYVKVTPGTGEVSLSWE